MCGRYYTEIDREEMQRIVDAVNRSIAGRPEGAQMKMGEIFPSNFVPAIISDQTKTTQATLMKWGFKGFSGSQLIINARSETVLEKPMFREAVMQRRCLIPASGYYEWEKQGKEKVKHSLTVKDDPLIYMAAIYRMEKDSTLPVFSILTRAATQHIRFIHDRMPVILDAQARDAWLGGDDDVQGLFEHSIQMIDYRPAV